MQTIYTPKGAAREYSPLAGNVGESMKPTRKSIGDIRGERSVYVIEVIDNDGKWRPINVCAGHALKSCADYERFHFLNQHPNIRYKDTRIALYARVEVKQ